MRIVDRWFINRRGIAVHVIRWERDTGRVIYLIPGYEHGECFSPLEMFLRDFREIEAPHE